VSTSIKHPKYPEGGERMRGEFILVGYSIKRVDEHRSLLKVYAAVDLKSNILPVFIKGPSKKELMKYIDSNH